ncbi:MAG TPA: type II secretion system protein GspJ [bacterium]|jgi:general secretion pathway protein J|nr:prepilin-type N-terminal cleavage/methylation domain-containing protein [Myxococcales bacterium]OQA59971.1 MAG: Pseudopilin GspJ [bacterium ADurb.Bin270]HPW45587.1 type II secretion system protein GspJ [bacterium]HQC50537.1 type II secretion system protein GspJ [bacterium]HQG13037.1 type II secretion system protein GspJ [bacterium]
MKNILQKGFTLLEVLIAVAILGVIMTLIWSSSSQSFRAKERTELRDSVFQNGRVVLRKISDDLAVAFLSKKVAGEGAGSEQAAFTSGAKTFFIGDDQGAQDLLKFTSLSHMRLYKQAKECDQVKISYEVVPSDEPGVYNLIRRADPWLDNTTDVKGKPLVLVEGIREFNLEYYHPAKREWMKTWNSEMVDWSMKLPMAVRIGIAFPDPDDDGAEITLSTAVMLALWENPIGL